MTSNKENKLALTTEDFVGQGRSLNFQTFTNLEKSITENEFKLKYVLPESHEVFTKDKVIEFVKSVSAKLNEIEKAEGTDERKAIVTAGIAELNSLKGVNVIKEDGKYATMFVRKKENGDELEKAYIGSLGMSDSGVTFKKTGKEVKEKLTEIQDKIEDKLMLIKTSINELSDLIPDKPTEPLGEWSTDGMTELEGLRVFHYCKTNYSAPTDNSKGTSSGFSDAAGKSIGYAASIDEATACRKYNDLIFKEVQAVKDLKKIKVFERNMEENKTYEMNLDQLCALGF